LVLVEEVGDLVSLDDSAVVGLVAVDAACSAPSDTRRRDTCPCRSGLASRCSRSVSRRTGNTPSPAGSWGCRPTRRRRPSWVAHPAPAFQGALPLLCLVRTRPLTFGRTGSATRRTPTRRHTGRVEEPSALGLDDLGVAGSAAGQRQHMALPRRAQLAAARRGDTITRSRPCPLIRSSVPARCERPNGRAGGHLGIGGWQAGRPVKTANVTGQAVLVHEWSTNVRGIDRRSDDRPSSRSGPDLRGRLVKACDRLCRAGGI
jgi:hypothetical protein